jgi:hypothetical protein
LQLAGARFALGKVGKKALRARLGRDKQIA